MENLTLLASLRNLKKLQLLLDLEITMSWKTKQEIDHQELILEKALLEK
jgi:hypothetical protein